MLHPKPRLRHMSPIPPRKHRMATIQLRGPERLACTLLGTLMSHDPNYSFIQADSITTPNVRGLGTPRLRRHLIKADIVRIAGAELETPPIICADNRAIHANSVGADRRVQERTGRANRLGDLDNGARVWVEGCEVSNIFAEAEGLAGAVAAGDAFAIAFCVLAKRVA